MNGGARGRVVVFCGPSLPPQTRPDDPAFLWRGPAVAGDAYALEADLPAAVVLIDGLFDERPAIRHKELLSLVARGVPVIGGASMGALRAAELHAHGMIGVGRIFEAYRTGRLERDDEVAVVHGPAEFGWAPLTEALVNVRATLAAAVRCRVLAPREGRAIRAIAAAIFFKQRTWPLVLDAAGAESAAPARVLRRLEAWLVEHRVDLKAADARACLEAAAIPGAPAILRLEPPMTCWAAALRETVASRLTPSPEPGTRW